MLKPIEKPELPLALFIMAVSCGKGKLTSEGVPPDDVAQMFS